MANATEDPRDRVFLDLFRRWRQALLRRDEAEKYQAEAKAELESIEGELRALARKAGA